jgi:putative sigma-54 modulation protein
VHKEKEEIMETKIQAIHFDATQALEAFINKKVERLARKNLNITEVTVTMKVVKPETALNKEARVVLTIPQHSELVAIKVADTFEEAIDTAIAALEPQLEKIKAKK